MATGTDMLWFPVGYTAGYLVLLVLVAAPLRRSGAYTLPDFAEGRLESRQVRRVAPPLGGGLRWALPVAPPAGGGGGPRGGPRAPAPGGGGRRAPGGGADGGGRG